MARFKWMGEIPRDGLTYISTTKLNVPTKSGGVRTYLPVSPETEFVVGQDIGYDVTDSISIVVMSTDPRFLRIS